MNITEFVEKWRKAEVKERSASQEHFIDLCRLLGHPTPVEADAEGNTYCFERGASKHGGGGGFADVWKKGFFAWEYKSRRKDLAAAFEQLLLYKDALENPPLLVVSDMERIVIHTNFTGCAPVTHEVSLANFAEPRSVEILAALFNQPEKLKPGVTSEAITDEAARRFAEVAESMRSRGLDPSQTAHFLDRIVFCLFAEDIDLLPDNLFTKIIAKAAGDMGALAKHLGNLFSAMATGGEFGLDAIRHFNGSLFDDQIVLELTPQEISLIAEASKLDWSAINPSIFGTLFERGLDPAKRAQLGAHFTGREDIELLVDAVVMTPLRREWSETRAVVESLLATGRKTGAGRPDTALSGQTPLSPTKYKKAKGEAELIVNRFLTRLQNVKILDASCGSGNFLYVSLFKLKDLEKEVIVFSIDYGLGSFLPMVGPWQLHGIEVNPYAFDLAQMTVWIGWLQWIRVNGFGSPPEPILRPMRGNFRLMDAILDLSDPTTPKMADWPTVDFIVGNPPFLGGNRIRKELGDDYVEKLFSAYDGAVPAFADLCCYWFEQARRHIAAGKCKRAGLLATQGIRGGANREVLKRIKKSGDIFWAISDKDWVLDGANVHVSLIAFDKGAEREKNLDGNLVACINPNLTSQADISTALPLPINARVCFMGPSPKAPFDIPQELAFEMLKEGNPHGCPNSDVLKTVGSAVDLVGKARHMWTIDFGLLGQSEAMFYEAPFEYVKGNVLPVRQSRKSQTNEEWWQYERPRVDMRKALSGLLRFVTTPAVSKHRIFLWRGLEVLCNQGTLVFTRSDDYFFGVLHSKIHELWALAQGTQLREKESGFRYTPTTCFETFPFPTLLGLNPLRDNPLAKAIGDAAKELNEFRENWLNPPDWIRIEYLEFPVTVGGPWDAFIDRSAYAPRPPSAPQMIHDPMSPGEEKPDPGKLRADTVNTQMMERLAKGNVGVARWPQIVPRDADCAAKLAKRTLTSLYNQRPTWLDEAHRKLDEAVFNAYGWRMPIADAEVLSRLLELNANIGCVKN